MEKFLPIFFLVLVGELLLGGNGHLVELFNIALRTWLLMIFLFIWSIDVVWKKRWSIFHIPSILTVIFSFLGVSIILGMTQGFKNGHNLRALIQDAIPFAFFLLFFPAREYLTKNRYAICQTFVKLFLALSTILSLGTLLLFSSGISVLQGPYYHWFRDVLGGKITDMGIGFFRIVLPEHLLLVPIMLFLIASIIRGREPFKQRLLTYMPWFVVASVPFIVNLSRTYLLGFIVGLIFLFTKTRWKEWLIVSGGSIVLMFLLFSIIHFAASRGTSFGSEFLTGRISSIATPDIERSAATRRVLLGPIWQEIKKLPVLGSGLGTNISFVDPVSNEPVTTRQFDWGYLEIWTELGLIGLFSYFSLITYIILHTTGAVRASTVALAVMNITTPVLFHVFGVALLVFFLLQTKKPVDAIAELDENG